MHFIFLNVVSLFEFRLHIVILRADCVKSRLVSYITVLSTQQGTEGKFSMVKVSISDLVSNDR